MDVTPMFKACVMTVKLRNKNLPAPNKNRILQKQAKDEFSKEVKDICHQITSLKTLLMENRAAYMKFACHLKNSAQMSDEQRDLIDRECEKIVSFYTRHLTQLRYEWKKKDLKRQRQEHVEAVLELLGSYLKTVQKIHLDQKRYRMQHELETYRLLKLESDKKKIPVSPVSDETYTRTVKQKKRNEDLDGWDHEDVESSEEEQENEPLLNNAGTESRSASKVALDEDIQKEQLRYEESSELSPEDIQVYESENMQLYNELQGLAEEVEQIEKNVVDIAKLQEIFTEKVVSQKHDIERISNTVVGATENVKDANEQIKQAIQRNAGLRVWALFFLLVMSFTLLFLDWYND